MKTKYQFLILAGKIRSPGYEREYDSAYQLYKSVWTQTMTEVHGKEHKLFSDDFTRQDYIQAVFFDGQCIALDCLRVIDLKNPADFDDSWFSDWDKKHLIELSKKGHTQCLVNSHFTVHEDHRKASQNEEHHVSYILGCLSVLHQLDLKFPVMLGMMRNNRSMNKLGQEWGASTLEANVPHYNIPSDLVAFFADNVRLASKKFPKVVMEIYKNKIDTFEKETHEEAA
jgi:hypothetical protein